ncbi:hypothetical protein Pyn_38240 [Prunus yedoensis var. nudiflora]|uniref:Uncharacterized protein n=1 Tax=Prunus yedoensis var. nudiflora TaxID=2094558 RepID=A0A314ZR20_PRUYE|nr:hypothetical protein Pyn_38240 [Prunus yedoensis var. nudiflora]
MPIVQVLVAQRQQNEIHSSKFAESKIRITYLRLSSKSASRCNDVLYTASLAAPSRLYLLEPEPCILSAKKKSGTPSLAECSCKFVASLRLGACGFPWELRKVPKTNFLDSTSSSALAFPWRRGVSARLTTQRVEPSICNSWA